MTVPEPIADYDRVWEEVYGDLQDLGPTHLHMRRIMRRMLAALQYSSVLDVGVGFGHNLPLLTEGRQLARIAGIDVSERALCEVRRHWQGQFTALDITQGSLPDTFELVCCSLVLEHVSDDESALANLSRMTSKFLLLTTIGGRFERYLPWERQMGHVRNYAAGELERKLDAAGLEVIEFRRWGFPFYSPLLRIALNRATATREMSSGSRLAGKLLDWLFFLNSSRSGDVLIVLARPR
jgi:SAM-dependent methyltransferase